MRTTVINIIGGPCAGKTTIASLIFAHLKLLKKVVEFASEYAKILVWKEDYEILNNQHLVSFEQYKLLQSINNKVEYIITDGSLIHGLYYNRTNPNNMSNVEKTEKAILNYYQKFNNIVIYLERNDIEYDTIGRVHTYQEALDADAGILNILQKYKFEYRSFVSNIDEIDNMIDYILKVSA